MGTDAWRPSASLDTLARRARFLADIRAFFAARDVLEADVPALSSAAALEPHLTSIGCAAGAQSGYLHTSPEFGLKRLLAAGSGPVYQLSHVFRRGERGRWHNPEFSMLEWYRPGWGEQALSDELDDLLAALGVPAPAKRRRFADVFEQYVQLDPTSADVATLAARARDLGCDVPEPPSDPRDARPFWLDALMGLRVNPNLGLEQPCLVVDFPAAMAGLTRVRAGQPPTAARFELYWRGVELANGGDELVDADALRQRFAAQSAARQRQRLSQPPRDERLLQAFVHGLPPCSGVAVGVDRLLALLLGHDGLAAVLPFTSERA